MNFLPNKRFAGALILILQLLMVLMYNPISSVKGNEIGRFITTVECYSMVTLFRECGRRSHCFVFEKQNHFNQDGVALVINLELSFRCSLNEKEERKTICGGMFELSGRSPAPTGQKNNSTIINDRERLSNYENKKMVQDALSSPFKEYCIRRKSWMRNKFGGSYKEAYTQLLWYGVKKLIANRGSSTKLI